MPRKIDISHRTIIFAVVFLLSLWVLYQIIDLILILFVAIILMSALSPVISLLTKIRLPKALAILITYVVLLTIFVSVLTVSFTPLITETTHLVLTLTPALAELLKIGQFDLSVVQSQITNFSGNILTFTKMIFNNILTLIFLLVFTFYLLLEKEKLERHTASLFGNQEARVAKILREIEEKLGDWMRGQLLLSLIIGVLSYIGLFILQIPYALPLAILAGLLEVVPVIGPILSAIPAVILALTISPILAGGVAAMYFIIQQLENHIIVPQVMKKAVGLNPLIIILAIAIGGRLLGVGGALLAVPIAVAVQIIVTDILLEK